MVATGRDDAAVVRRARRLRRVHSGTARSTWRRRRTRPRRTASARWCSALINGHYDVAGALVQAGIDPNLVDYTGRGGLYAAIDFNTMPSSNRPGAEGDRGLVDGARRRSDAARARRRSERAARALAAVSRQARPRQRLDARRRHHAVPARREGRRPASDAPTASTRRDPTIGTTVSGNDRFHTRRNQPA